MTNTTIHPFEKAGLGKAPFRCIGSYESKFQACQGAPILPGSSCDYCAQGIIQVYVIKSADGRKFKVGCDCVAKVCNAGAKTDLEREMATLRADVNRVKRAASHKRDDAKIATAREQLASNRAALDGMIFDGVVRGFEKFGPRSMADQIEWMLTHGGRALKLRGAKLLAEVLS